MPRRSASMAAGLALVSLVTLVYELVQIRVFSFSLHPLIGEGIPREADLIIDVRFLINPYTRHPLRPTRQQLRG